MNRFDDISVLTKLRDEQKSSAPAEKWFELPTPLTVGQIVAVREFLELIGKWDEEESNNGN